MKLIDATWKRGNTYEVLILADKTPAVLPTSGKDVDGMSDSHTFAPMSAAKSVSSKSASPLWRRRHEAGKHFLRSRAGRVQLGRYVS